MGPANSAKKVKKNLHGVAKASNLAAAAARLLESIRSREVARLEWPSDLADHARSSPHARLASLR